MKTVAANLNTLQFVAASAASGVMVLKTREDLEKLETKQILGLFNSLRETPLKKFDSRAIGIERLAKMIETETSIPEITEEQAEVVKADVGNVIAAAVSEVEKLPEVIAETDAAKAASAKKAADAAAKAEKTEAAAKAKAEKEAAKATVTVKRVRTELPAVDRIIKYGKDNAVFTLEQAEKDLGIKKTCMRTHMSFINSNGVRFGEVKFIGNRTDKTYTMKSPTRPLPAASK